MRQKVHAQILFPRLNISKFRKWVSYNYNYNPTPPYDYNIFPPTTKISHQNILTKIS